MEKQLIFIKYSLEQSSYTLLLFLVERYCTEKPVAISVFHLAHRNHKHTEAFSFSIRLNDNVD